MQFAIFFKQFFSSGFSLQFCLSLPELFDFYVGFLLVCVKNGQICDEESQLAVIICFSIIFFHIASPHIVWFDLFKIHSKWHLFLFCYYLFSMTFIPNDIYSQWHLFLMTFIPIDVYSQWHLFLATFIPKTFIPKNGNKCH